MAQAQKKDDPLSITSAEARGIAKDAYIYGFPMVDNYRVIYSYFVDTTGPEYKGAWNTVHNTARVYTPDDKTIQTPNSDTPYSMVGADLRAEPIVLSVPAVKDRYYSLQFIDLYTFNFAYVGSRATGAGAGNYMLVGPKWIGEKPANVTDVIRCETEFALVAYRTQLFGPDDLDNVKQIQAGYKAQPLSVFLGKPTPAPAPAINFPKPLTAEQERKSLEVFGELDFILRYCPTHPSERDLMQRFTKLGIGAGGNFDPRRLSPEVQKAVEDGIADAWSAYAGNEKKMAAGELTSGDLFGTREFLNNDYLKRMTAAVDGIYGNSKQEAMYPIYMVDGDGKPLDASKNNYTLTLSGEKMPPVNAFWSLTMYDFPARMLIANPLNRYLINSPMLPQLKREADGGVTLYVQRESPGPERESNWLPAPNGPLFSVLRLYWPKPEAYEGGWKPPPMQRVP